MTDPLPTERPVPQVTKRRSLIQAVAALVVFCGLSGLSRLYPAALLAVVFSGVAFPLLWSWRTGNWTESGFTRRRLGQALLWGLAVGLLLLAIIWFMDGDRHTPSMFWLQLAIAIPMWVLIMSPFQEFFFRGWLQPRLQNGLGRWPGLVAASMGFALWHLCPPFEQAQIVPIMTVSSVFFMFAMGLAFGYALQRTANITAPWLAHVLAGLALVITGAMSFVQFND